MNKRRTDKSRFKLLRHRCISALVISGYCIVTFWLFWPYNPFVVNNIKICNSDRVVQPGQYLVYEMDVDKKLPLAAVINKQLINDFIITYSPIYGNIPVGKRKMKVKLKIPSSAEPGEYVFKWEGVYKVNPLREVTVTAFSDPFYVERS
jgi:hypothetical protein